MKKAIFQIPAFDKIDGIAVMDTLSGEPYFIDYEVQTNPSEITLAYSKVSNSAENPLTVFGENEKVAKPRFEKAVSAKLSVQKGLV